MTTSRISRRLLATQAIGVTEEASRAAEPQITSDHFRTRAIHYLWTEACSEEKT